MFKIKKVLVTVFIFMLLGCSNLYSNTNSKEENRFLAEDKNKIALFIVGDDLESFELEEEGINNIQSVFNASSLKVAQHKYPFLKLKEEPTYIVFDNKEEVYRSNDYKELVSYLKKIYEKK